MIALWFVLPLHNLQRPNYHCHNRPLALTGHGDAWKMDPRRGPGLPVCRVDVGMPGDLDDEA